jgi:hypothetical protein
MTPCRRERAVTMTAASAADLAGLLTILDEFVRSSPRITDELAVFLASRGSRFPEFETGNLIDHLSFTALGLRQQAAPATARKETP